MKYDEQDWPPLADQAKPSGTGLKCPVHGYAPAEASYTGGRYYCLVNTDTPERRCCGRDMRQMRPEHRA